VRAAIDRAWRLPAASLEERVARTQRAGMMLGLTELDGPARALIFLQRDGDPLERARLAASLAPSLPAAHAALARARLEARDLPGAWRALRAALGAAPRHLEARAWLGATGALAATTAGLAFALLFALLGAAAALPSLSHGLGATRLKLGGPAALAALGAAVLALAVAEGPAGAALGLAGLAIASGSAAKRAGVAVAVAIGLVALHVGLERISAGRLLLVADPVATAIHRVEVGLPTPVEVGVALRAATSDGEAVSAVALHAKRSGDLDAAAQYFARVLGQHPEAADYVNAANVALQRNDVKRAIALYQEATRRAPSAIGYYNLSQAYGRAIRLDDQDRALASAQALDASAVEHLAAASGIGDQAYVGDAALPAGAVAARVDAGGATRQLAAVARERLAPGWLGDSPKLGALLALAVLGLAAAGGIALERASGPRDFYADLARTLRAGAVDSAQRVAQLTRLRARRARTERLLSVLALLVPGAAGFRFGRPLAAFVASAACAVALAIVTALRAAPPDPLAVGELPGLLAQLALALCGALYLLATAAAFALRTEE
jgi:tetratricopeptide (TPR) repeat protein